MTFLPPNALEQHIAILGKTGSGKTSTGKLLVEHVAREGARVCVLDPIKSDWWGLISVPRSRAILFRRGQRHDRQIWQGAAAVR